MEILSGKHVAYEEFDEGENIVDWVKSKMKSKDGIEGAECSSVSEEMVTHA